MPGGGGKSSWVNLKLRRCVTCFTSCFVFSLQGGGLQKWKPLTQTPEPQRYNIPHLSLIFLLDFLNFSLLLCLHMNSFTVASSSEKWFRASSLISEWLVVVQTGGSLIKAIVKEVINIHWASLQQTVVLLLYVCMWRPHAPAYRGSPVQPVEKFCYAV